MTAAATVSMAIASAVGGASTAAAQEKIGPTEPIMLKGSTTASYFWDDGSGRAGDTGMPASGEPMQKGMAASPSWPLMTEGYVIYNGERADFFVGDRGPGEPSSRGIMLDLDGETFADLTGGTFNTSSLWVDGNGGQGHIEVEYVITKWGDGPGNRGEPVPFSTGAYSQYDSDPADPVVSVAEAKANRQAKAEAEEAAARRAEEKKERARVERVEQAQKAARAEKAAQAEEKDRKRAAALRRAADSAMSATTLDAVAPDGATDGGSAELASQADSGPGAPAVLGGFVGLLVAAATGYAVFRRLRPQRVESSTSERIDDSGRSQG